MYCIVQKGTLYHNFRLQGGIQINFFSLQKNMLLVLTRSTSGDTRNSFPASGDFCRLLITFANSLESDQAQQNRGPELNPNCSTLCLYS